VDAELQQVCFTSSWVLSIASATSPVHLSPGDIDEVHFTVLMPTSPNQTREVKATSFERSRAPQGTAQRPQRLYVVDAPVPRPMTAAAP